MAVTESLGRGSSRGPNNQCASSCCRGHWSIAFDAVGLELDCMARLSRGLLHHERCLPAANNAHGSSGDRRGCKLGWWLIPAVRRAGEFPTADDSSCSSVIGGPSTIMVMSVDVCRLLATACHCHARHVEVVLIATTAVSVSAGARVRSAGSARCVRMIAGAAVWRGHSRWGRVASAVATAATSA